MKKLGLVFAVLGMAFLIGCQQPLTVQLCQKTAGCEGGEWVCDQDGAVAYLSYCAKGYKFSYEVQGTVPLADTDYVLIYYPDPWPGQGLICLGTATSDSEGNISMDKEKGIQQDLPIPSDENYPAGAKIWLVPADMVDCEAQQMVDWSGCSDILFETQLITYTYGSPFM